MCRGETALISLRERFWRKVDDVSDIPHPTISHQAIPTFQALLTNVATTHHLAELVFNVIELYEEYLPIWPHVQQ